MLKQTLKKLLLASILAGALNTASNAQISYTQGWETAGLNSWTSNGLLMPFENTTATACTGSRSVYTNSFWGFGADLISPALTGNNGGPLTISFKYKALEYGSTTAGVDPLDIGVITLEWGTSATGPWNNLLTINSSNHVMSASCSTVTTVLNAVPSSGNIFIRINVVVDEDADVYIDDVAISQGATPTCFMPSAVTLTTLVPTSAGIAWTAPSAAPAGGYEYYYSTTNTAPTSSTTPSGSTAAGITTANIGSLVANTTYYAWVRSVCSSSDKSVWTNAISFTTPCVASTVPYLEDFQSVTVPAIPICTQVQNAGSGNNWMTGDVTNYGFSGQYLGYPYNSSNDANAWFYTKGLTLTAGTSYQILYEYGSTGSTYPERMKVAVGTIPLSTSMTNVLADHNNINQGTKQYGEVFFTPTATGVYYFGFNAYSLADMNILYLDNIAVNVAPTCYPPSNATTTAVNVNDVSISWTAPTTAPGNGYEYYYSTTNTPPTGTTTPSGTTLAGVTSATIGTLTGNTKYYYWVRSNCSATDKSSWTPTDSFTTQLLLPTPWTEGVASNTIVPEGYMVSGNGSWYIGDVSVIAGNPLYYFYVNQWQTSNNHAELHTPNIGPILANDQLKFDYRYTNYTNPLVPTAGSGSFKVSLSTNYGATWTQIDSLPNPTDTLWHTLTYNLGANVGQNVKVKFTSDWYAGDYYFALDNLHIGPAPCVAPVVALGADTAICVGTSLTLDAGAGTGLSYLWSNGATTQTIDVTTAGTYWVSVSSGSLATCTATDTIIVSVTPLPSGTGINLTNSSPSFEFYVAGAQHTNTFNWNFGDGSPGESGSNVSHTYAGNGTYTVTVVLTNDCGTTTLTQDVTVTGASINKLQLDADALKLYPNPASHSVKLVNESNMKMKHIVVSNILGQTILTMPVQDNKQQFIDVSSLTSGIYNVRIEFENGSVFRKLEIIK